MSTSNATPRIACKPTENDTVSVAFLEADDTGRFVKMPAQDAARLAAALLEAARQSTQSPTRRPPESTNLSGVVGLVPTDIRLAPGALADEVTAVVYMGQARIGFRLQFENARQLGQALIAASSAEDRPN